MGHDTTYRLPGKVASDGRYHLAWLRQVGTPNDTLTATIEGRTFQADPAERRFEVSVPVA